MVVLNLFFNYGIYTFYKPAEFEKFCPAELNQKQYADKEACEKVGGSWYEGKSNVLRMEGGPTPIVSTVPTESAGWCDATAKCREGFEVSQAVYNRNVFVVLVILGLVSLGSGFMLISAKPVANGFLGGGILSLIVGAIRYWSSMDDYLRFVILGIALAVLIWLGYKKISDRQLGN